MKNVAVIHCFAHHFAVDPDPTVHFDAKSSSRSGYGYGSYPKFTPVGKSAFFGGLLFTAVPGLHG